MFRLVPLVLLSCLLTRVSCLITFINPPPSGEKGDFGKNPTFAVGSIVNIAWQGGEDGVGVSIVLYQLNQTDGQWFGDMEYLTQNSLSTKYSWLVGTRKNTTLSNLFYLSIYQEGKVVSDSNSHYFNITTAKEAAVTTTSSTSPSSTSSATHSASGTESLPATLSSSASSTLFISTPTNVSNTASSSSLSAKAPESFPTAAKIGLGVAIPTALVLGIAVGFLLFRRHRKRGAMAAPMAAASYPPSEAHSQFKHHEASYHTSKSHEAPLMSPVELSYLGGPYNTYQNNQAGRTSNKDGEQVRYEM